MEYETLISNEKSNVEFKRELPERKEGYIKTIVAFLNSDVTSYLFIGICDKTKQPYKIDVDKTIMSVSNDIKNMISPYENITIDTFLFDGYNIVVLVIEPGNHTPYSYYDGSGQKYYIRNGSETVVADNLTLRKLLHKGDNIRFDEQYTKYTLDDLTFDSLKGRYRELYSRELTNSTLESLELVNESGNLCNAALLLSDQNPNKDAYCNCIRFKGLDRALVIDKKVLNGSILDQIEDARKFLLNNMKIGYHKKFENTVKDYEYPIEAVMEAIVNAIAHRNYLDDGTQVDVYMYDNRLEISSTGKPFSGLDISEIAKDPKSHRRNKLLCDVLQRLQHMDRDGTGIIRINKICRNEGIEVEYYQKGKDVYVRFNSPLYDDTQQVPIKNDSDRVTKLVEFLKINNHITVDDCMGLFSIKRTAATDALKNFENIGLIKNISKRPLKYVLNF